MVKDLKITLKSARVNKGLTQEQACVSLGISKKTLSNWENGITSPPLDKLDAICKLYEVDYDNLNFLAR